MARSSGYSSVALGAISNAINAITISAVADTTSIGGQKIVFPDAISLTVGKTTVEFTCCTLCGALLNTADELAVDVHANWHRMLAPLLQLLGEPDTRRGLMRLMRHDLEHLLD